MTLQVLQQLTGANYFLLQGHDFPIGGDFEPFRHSDHSWGCECRVYLARPIVFCFLCDSREMVLGLRLDILHTIHYLCD